MSLQKFFRWLVSLYCCLVFSGRTKASSTGNHGLWLTMYNNTAQSGNPIVNEPVQSLSVAINRISNPFQSMTVQGQLYPPSGKKKQWVLFAIEGDTGYARLWVDDHLMVDKNLSQQHTAAAQYAIPVPFFPATATSTMSTSRIRLDFITHNQLPSFLRVLANGTEIATNSCLPEIPKAELEYQRERMESERGWNTWLSTDMLTHALLPHGIGVSLELCGSETCVSKLGQDLPSCDSTRFPAKHGLHDVRGQYTEVERVIVDNATQFRVETATTGPSNEILVVVISALQSLDFALKARLSVPPDFAPRYCHLTTGQQGYGNHTMLEPVVASCPGFGQVVLQLVDGSGVLFSNKTGATLSVTNSGDNNAVAFVASTERDESFVPTKTSECIRLVEEARKRLLSKYERFGEDNETVAGMLTAISWNVIYTPYEGIITPVFRGHGWAVSFAHSYVLFEWDTYLASMIAVWTDPWVARNNIIRMTKSLNYQGFVAGFWNGLCGEVDKTKPPVAGLVLEYLLKHDSTAHTWLPQLVFPQLVQWNRWFTSNRQFSLETRAKNTTAGVIAPGSSRANMDIAISCDCIRDQSPELASKCETGLDNSPLYDNATFVTSENVLDSVDVGMSSLFIRDCQALSKLAASLGHDDFATEFRQRERASVQELNTHLWNDQDSIYLNKLWTTGAWAPLELAPTYFYPMLIRAPTDAQVLTMMTRYLVNSSEFAVNNETKYCLPSISRSSHAYVNEYWRGRSWGPMTLLVYLGLEEYSHLPLVQEARKNLAGQSKSTFLPEWVANHRVMENYNSDTGTGCDVGHAVPFYHWGALNALVALTESRSLHQVKQTFVGHEQTELLTEVKNHLQQE